MPVASSVMLPCVWEEQRGVTLTTTGALSGAQLGVRTVGISHAAS